MKPVIDRTAAVKKEVQSRLADLTAGADEKDRRLYDRVNAAFNDVSSLDDQIVKLLRANTNSRAGDLELTTAVKIMNDALGDLDRLNDNLRRSLVADMKSGRDSSTLAQWLMIGVPAVGLPISLLLALVVARSITRPIARGVEVSEAIARGDLTQRLRPQTERRDRPSDPGDGQGGGRLRPDEVGNISRCFRRASPPRVSEVSDGVAPTLGAERANVGPGQPCRRRGRRCDDRH